MLPLSLYIHLPWCVKKCPYCDFNSFTASQDAPRSRYLGAVKEDLKRQSADVADRPLHTVFIGGGTPSFFSPEEIGSLVDAVRGHYRLEPGIEITMEANPSSVESGDPA
nr:radical SAM protein [Woeseiaceae bacterium]